MQKFFYKNNAVYSVSYANAIKAVSLGKLISLLFSFFPLVHIKYRMKFQERVALSQVVCIQSGDFARCMETYRAHPEESGQDKQISGFNS